MSIPRSRRYWLSRWPLAGLLNRSSRTCWADLVTWALGWHKSEPLAEVVERIDSGRECRAESLTTRHRACYCQKFREGQR